MCNTAKGFIVVNEPIVIKETAYFGVDTGAWPIGTIFDSKIATDICEISYLDLGFPMLIDLASAVRYCHSCEIAGIKPRVLYCEVVVNHSKNDLPQFENPLDSSFLGFDFAYPSGDYYSAVVNDIIYQDRSLPTHWKKHLNEFGLLPTKEELIQFAKERAFFAKKNLLQGRELLFEKGNFVSFCLYHVDYSDQ